MNDRGLAALAAAIHSLHHHVTIANGQPSPDFDGEFAAAILGERGVFLPEEDCGHVGFLKATVLHDEIRDRDVTIERLRAALDGLRADDLWLGVELHAVGNLMFPEPMVSASGARAAIRAALAKAKEATDGK